jgi:hypothetical protein
MAEGSLTTPETLRLLNDLDHVRLGLGLGEAVLARRRPTVQWAVQYPF